MKRSYKIIETDKRASSIVRKILLLIWIVFVILIIILTDNAFESYVHAITSSILIVLFVPNFVKKYHEKGIITLSNENVIIEESNQTITLILNEIHDLKIRFRGSFGDSSTFSYVLGTWLSEFKNGAGNFISFKQNENEYKFEFLCKNSQDLRHLKIFDENYNENCIVVKHEEETPLTRTCYPCGK